MKAIQNLTTITRCLLLLICLSIPTLNTVHANEEAPYDIAVRLQTTYNTISSLSFHFNQRTQDELGGRPRKGSGDAYFYKNEGIGKMRWNYADPNQQVLVSDGETFSMYFSELNQMTVLPAETLDQDLTYSFFTGKGNLVEDFLIFIPDNDVAINSSDEPTKVIKLVPKEVQSQVQHIHLWITERSLIQRIEVKDHFNTRTILNFSNIEVDSLLDQSAEQLIELFQYSPPPGTEIIEQ